MFFQKLTLEKYGWDEVLNTALQIEWCKLNELLVRDELFYVERYYFSGCAVSSLEKVTLHGFCDASEISIAAVVYLVGEMGETRRSSFVVSKTRVSPVKKVSIPRLELCACVLLSQLVSNVQNALQGVVPIGKIVCWNDSLDALCWIKNEKPRKVFVENRVKKI